MLRDNRCNIAGYIVDNAITRAGALAAAPVTIRENSKAVAVRFAAQNVVVIVCYRGTGALNTHADCALAVWDEAVHFTNA